ncbi:hypothetical protein [Maridesulfovibrio sp.]|uniref:hypothetical protein n=1 Tax=unclassified Maridesulfovibrio TaxID=2794999 RepID=UPI003B009E5D
MKNSGSFSPPKKLLNAIGDSYPRMQDYLLAADCDFRLPCPDSEKVIPALHFIFDFT